MLERFSAHHSTPVNMPDLITIIQEIGDEAAEQHVDRHLKHAARIGCLESLLVAMAIRFPQVDEAIRSHYRQFIQKSNP